MSNGAHLEPMEKIMPSKESNQTTQTSAERKADNLQRLSQACAEARKAGKVRTVTSPGRKTI